MRLDLLSRPAWQASLARFAVLLAAAASAGVALGHVERALVVALFGYALFSLFNLYRLRVWLESRQRVAPPDLIGAWGEVAEFIHFRLRAARARQRRLVRLLRAFREAADALPDAVIVLDAQRKIVWLNRAAGRLLRLKLARDRGRLVDDFLPNPQVRAWLADLPEREPLFDVPSPEDEGVRLALRMMPYGGEQRLLIVRDISVLARLEQVRRDFVANVSHELRTPLTVLHGYLDLIEPDEAPGFAPILDDLRAQSRRMAQIVEDLLTLSRLEAPQARPKRRCRWRRWSRRSPATRRASRGAATRSRSARSRRPTSSAPRSTCTARSRTWCRTRSATPRRAGGSRSRGRACRVVARDSP